MNAKKKTTIIASIAILLVAFIVVAFLATQRSSDYYTQIDNDCVTEIAPHGAMNYRYTLSTYDETGAERELSFETSRILTDDAYLCLKVAPFRGVVTWAEVQFDEMPAAVQEQYTFDVRPLWIILPVVVALALFTPLICLRFITKGTIQQRLGVTE